MYPISPAIDRSVDTADAATTQRVLHAAHEFEAILLNTLLGSLEHSFVALPGKDPSDSDNYQSLGVQALASGLSARGGLGIASMIARSLMRHPSFPGKLKFHPCLSIAHGRAQDERKTPANKGVIRKGWTCQTSD